MTNKNTIYSRILKLCKSKNREDLNIVRELIVEAFLTMPYSRWEKLCTKYYANDLIRFDEEIELPYVYNYHYEKRKKTKFSKKNR